jgi:hypothetical protein
VFSFPCFSDPFQKETNQLEHKCPLPGLNTETFLATRSNPYCQAGVAEWLSRWPRDPNLHIKRAVPNGQASQWASCSQGFESLPRRHTLTPNSAWLEVDASVYSLVLHFDEFDFSDLILVPDMCAVVRLLVHANDFHDSQ